MPKYAQQTIIQLLNDEKDVETIKAITKAIMKCGAEMEDDVYEGIVDSKLYKDMFSEMFGNKDE